ncbi:unnamed protein product [Caenorhabditis sp. 36 PRJEB53466]|nr:unnamed protein product [Caenorhabditis sp. 36 PRJEB53466]
MPDPSENVEDAVDILEKEMISFCNLIPVNSWGFDDDVKESLKMRKHSLVNRQLSKKERKSMSAQQKQHLAKGLGLVPNTVQEVLEWMSNSKQHSKVQPVRSVAPPVKKEQVKKTEKKEKKVEKPPKKVTSELKDSEESDQDESEEKAQEPAPKNQKQQRESDDEDDENSEGQEEEDDDDSTDEETEEPAAKKIKIAPQSVLKSNDKIEKEIKKLEEDEDNESPEIKRQIALLRLQKKLKEMKTERKGKGPTKVTAAMADKLAEEKRLKRRESKLKLKQRRAEEKKGKEVKKEIENQNQNKEDGVENGVPEKKEKSGISFNNLKFEIKEDKQRGKKQRTAKKDRALKLTGRDYKSLIAKVEETKATIEKVREADPHKATIMEDELKWEKTLKRAAGGKVKDNLEMLKKALAKKNKLKDRKKEKWQNRDNKVEGEKQTKQEKRKSNLQKRIDDVKKRKMNKLRKKGRIM